MNKYELTDETKVFYGVTLHRIRALTAVGVLAAAGQLGGWVESEKNLEQSGDAWVYGNARVSGDARVSGNARVSGDAQVSGDAWVSGDARVFGDAWVCSDAQVSGNARVFGDARVSKTRHYLLIGPVGSEDRTVTICRTRADDTTGHYVQAGCWAGTVDQLAERITTAWPDLSEKKRARYRGEYEAVIALARPRIQRWVK